MKSSGIGGQAVLEGVMMRHKDKVAVAVRRTDGVIEVGRMEYHNLTEKNKFFRLPVVRGVVSFISSLIIGIKTLMYSATFFEEEEEQTKKDDGGKGEKAMIFWTLLFSIVFAVAIFMVLPYYLSALIMKLIGSDSQLLLAVIEGIFKLAIFVGYLAAISLMKDIRRTFMYHGAEHKSINCIESGLPLTVDNVMASSKEHRRCGTSFVVFVLVLSIIVFMFIHVDNHLLRIAIRLLLIPIIAGIAFEFIQWAGNSDSKAAAILAKPGLWVQALTTKEPERDMCEVAIASVEAVFDWREYLRSMGVEIAEPEKEDVSEGAGNDIQGSV